MTNDKRIKNIGDIGEELVAKYFNANLSEDYFDPVCDMRTDQNKTIEVKTQYPFGSMMTVKTNQLPKCLEADHLIFVIYDHTDEIKLYDVPKYNRTKFKVYQTKSGRDMAGWNMSNAILLDTIKNHKIASQLQTLSTSKTLKSKLKYL
jgi:hypothetical protein